MDGRREKWVMPWHTHSFRRTRGKKAEGLRRRMYNIIIFKINEWHLFRYVRSTDRARAESEE